MKQNLTTLEKNHKELRMQNKIFNDDIKKYKSSLNKLKHTIKKLRLGNEYRYLLELEKNIDELNIALGKAVATQKKMQKIELTDFESVINNSKKTIDKIKLRNPDEVVLDEDKLEVKRKELSEVIEKIGEYGELILDLRSNIDLGVKEYTEDEIYNFNEEISNYMKEIVKLDTKISDLEIENMNLEQTGIEPVYTYTDASKPSEITDELTNLKTKLNVLGDAFTKRNDGEIDDKKTLIIGYYDKINGLKKLIKEDDSRLTEEDMASAKIELSKLLEALDEEQETKAELNNTANMLIETKNFDTTNMINILKLKMNFAKSNISIMDRYAKLHKDQLKASKESIINGYKDKKSKSINDYFKLAYKKATL